MRCIGQAPLPTASAASGCSGRARRSFRRASRLASSPAVCARQQSSADDFFLQCNGKRFNSFEEAVCRVVFVATATFDLASSASSPSPTSATAGAGAATIPSPAFDASTTPTGGGNSSAVSPPPPPLRPALLFSPIGGSSGHGSGGGGVTKVGTGAGAGAAAAAGVGGGGLLSPEKAGAAAAADAAWEYDASTCVICMDRMESRVLTTVCNHSFHVECLMKWQDSPCPVCRFHHNNASEASTCQVRLGARWEESWSRVRVGSGGCSGLLLDSSAVSSPPCLALCYCCGSIGDHIIGSRRSATAFQTTLLA